MKFYATSLKEKSILDQEILALSNQKENKPLLGSEFFCWVKEKVENSKLQN